MTVQETLNLITPLIPGVKSIGLTDASVITWDFSQGNVANVTIGASRTLQVTNLSANSFGLLTVTQGAGGQKTISLPGNQQTSLTFSANAGDKDLLGFFYDGTTFYWSITNYGQVIIPTVQLQTPGNYNLNVISDTEIDSTWNSVPSASTYVIQRTTDSSYSTGLANVFSSASLSFNDLNLSASTAYYYRLKATAFGYIDSNWVTGSATTQASQTPFYLQWNNITATQNEQFNSNQGIRKQLSPNTSSASLTYSTTTISNGEVFDYATDSVSSNVFSMFLATSSASTTTNSDIDLALNSTINLLTNNNPLLSANLFHPSNGNRLRVQYTDGWLSILYSTDGTTWNVYYLSYISPATSYTIGFSGGVAGLGSSNVFKVIAPLSPVRNFVGLCQPGGTQVNMSWNAVVSASRYTLQRAITSSFSGSTTLYTGSGTSFNDTGLTNGTTYYYRLQANGSSNSAWYNKTIVTSTAGDLNYLQFQVSGTKAEPINDYKSVRLKAAAKATETAYTYCTSSIGTGSAIVFDILNKSSDVYTIGLNTNTTTSPSAGTIEMVLNGTLSVNEGGTAKISGLATSNFQRWRLECTTGSIFRVAYSNDTGSTWTVAYSSSLSATSSYFPGFQGATINSGPINFYQMSI
jgi:hypothetical protein